MSADYIEVKTRENTKVWLNKSQISAVEEVPATSRSEGYVKVYVAGYHFILEITAAEFLAKLT